MKVVETSNDNTGNITKTGCKDCGRIISHWHPESRFGHGFVCNFNNVHCTIWYDHISGHYLHYLHGSPEKVFYSCKHTLEQIIKDKEIGNILAWAEIESD